MNQKCGDASRFEAMACISVERNDVKKSFKFEVFQAKVLKTYANGVIVGGDEKQVDFLKQKKQLFANRC